MTLVPSYLRCLLSAAALRSKFQIETIPHYGGASPSKFYTALLQGKEFEITRRASKPQLALRAEFDDEAPQPIEDVPQEQLDGNSNPEEDETFEDALARLVAEEEEAMRLAAEEGAEDVPAGGEDEIVEVPEDETVEVPGEGEVAPPEPPAEAAPRRARGARNQTIALQWGPCVISRSVSQAGHPFVEARCVFHKLDTKTGCKKTFGFDNDSEPLVLGALKHWCNTSRDFDRQRHHMQSLKRWDDVPVQSEEVLLANRIPEAEKPDPQTVRTDKELDADDAPARRARGRGRRAQSQGERGQAAREGRGRGRRAQGRGGPQRRTASRSRSRSGTSSSSSFST
jgi:hypothetical protein